MDLAPQWSKDIAYITAELGIVSAMVQYGTMSEQDAQKSMELLRAQLLRSREANYR